MIDVKTPPFKSKLYYIEKTTFPSSYTWLPLIADEGPLLRRSCKDLNRFQESKRIEHVL